jgi:hypothetical protein
VLDFYLFWIIGCFWMLISVDGISGVCTGLAATGVKFLPSFEPHLLEKQVHSFLTLYHDALFHASDLVLNIQSTQKSTGDGSF